MNFNYIKPSEDEIFKKLPKQGAKKTVDTSNVGGGYANLEDIMNAQTKKR